MKEDLFDDQYCEIALGPGALLLKGFARDKELALISAVSEIASKSPFRHMITPSGFRMSVSMTNCGVTGWVTDLSGYRYQEIDPLTNSMWPSLPTQFVHLAHAAALKAGFSDFEPDTCLINRYEPGAKLTLHQDKDEKDYSAPIVSISLGLPATFLFGGLEKKDPIQRIPLFHGDVIIWGGPSRLFYHGIMPIKKDSHFLVGSFRINLTFRKAALTKV